MKFWKLHGIGNDFIAIDGRFDDIPNDGYSELAKSVCHRRFSVGADGLLVVKNSSVGHVEMVYYNADGSRAAMCGNGLRCFVKFVYDNNIVRQEEFDVDTLDGLKKISLKIVDDKIESIKVNMGQGSFYSKDIPANLNKDTFIKEKLQILDKTYEISAMLMGVPHAVILVEDFDMEEVYQYGSLIEKNSIFPKGINVNFVKVIDESNILVRTWERGCGYTLGCGTGMTASAIISNKLGLVEKSVKVESEGGVVQIDIDKFVYMTGPAVKICEGILEVD